MPRSYCHWGTVKPNIYEVYSMGNKFLVHKVLNGWVVTEPTGDMYSAQIFTTLEAMVDMIRSEFDNPTTPDDIDLFK